MTNGNDFDADLAELGRIRFTLEDMKRYGLHGGLPQEQAFFLLGFIDKLWKEYVRLQAESEAWDKLSLVQLSHENQRLNKLYQQAEDKYQALMNRRVADEPGASHYCIDCNEAHDPRTCGALKSGKKS